MKQTAREQTNASRKSSLAHDEVLSLKNSFRLNVETLRIQASGFSSVVVVFKKNNRRHKK
jgi:hypothetical protein